MEQPRPKPQLHSSRLQMLWRCGEKFRRVVINGEREPSGVPLIIGSATHSTAAQNLTQKKDKGFLLTREAVQDYAMDNFAAEWNKSTLILNEEEQEQGINKVKGTAQDHTIALSLGFHYDVAPKVRPSRIERPWVLVADGYPFDLAGRWDYDEDFFRDMRDAEPQRIVKLHDIKTRKTDAGQAEVDRSDQYTLYAMAKKTIDGIMPQEVIQDTLIKPTKTNPDGLVRIYRSTRTQEDFAIFFRRFEAACRIIEKGIFTPASSYGFDSPCHYCGFALDGSCKFINSKRIFKSTTQQTKGGTHGTTKKSTAELIAGLAATVRNGNAKPGVDRQVHAGQQ